MALMFPWCLWLIVSMFFFYVLSGNSETLDQHDRREVSQDLPGSINYVFKLQETLLTVQREGSLPSRQSPRSRKAKQRLLEELSRSRGRWGDSHPRKRLLDALYGFSRYYHKHIHDVDRWRKLYGNVSGRQRRLLERTISYTENFIKADEKLKQNQLLCDEIVRNALEYYEISRQELDQHIKEAEKRKYEADKTSVSQALKHIVRDWTDDGTNERANAFPCILETLKGLFPDRDQDSPAYRVLLPGSGLGRLGYEVAGLGGFEVTNNEVSLYMTVMYRFIESQSKLHAFTVRPFADGWSHHATRDDMFRELSFPSMLMDNPNAILVEGDFTTAFGSEKGQFDVVVTHFFIDTARNLMSYFDTIISLLKPGGYWVNFGPLLYGTGPWVQLTLEEIIDVTEAMGFQYVDAPESCGPLTFPDKKVRTMEAAYGMSPAALTKNVYRAQAWVARRQE